LGAAASLVAPPVAPIRPVDPDLARVLNAWPDLPEPIRRAVLALVETAVPTHKTP
jgi:hypothetical protein